MWYVYARADDSGGGRVYVPPRARRRRRRGRSRHRRPRHRRGVDGQRRRRRPRKVGRAARTPPAAVAGARMRTPSRPGGPIRRPVWFFHIAQSLDGARLAAIKSYRFRARGQHNLLKGKNRDFRTRTLHNGNGWWVRSGGSVSRQLYKWRLTFRSTGFETL